MHASQPASQPASQLASQRVLKAIVIVKGFVATILFNASTHKHNRVYHNECYLLAFPKELSLDHY
jgi:hypothetical protein